MSSFDNSSVEFITLGMDTQNLVEDVVEKVRRAVVATMGPNGKLCVITTGTKPKVTKDGVTVARAINFNDPRKEVINKIVTEASIKTDEECGDGTTTTTMLLAELFKIYREFSTYQQHAFIDKLCLMWIEELRNRTINVTVDDERLVHLARTSSNNDTLLSDAVVDIYRTSENGFPSVELVLGTQSEDKIIRTNGLNIEMQYSNTLYAGINSRSGVYKGFVPIILDDYIRGNDPTKLFELMAKYDKIYSGKSVTVLLIARSIENNMDNTILAFNNALRQQSAKRFGIQDCLQFVGCRMNGTGGSVGSMIMQDLSIMFGVPMFSTMDQAIDEEVGVVLEEVTITQARSIFNPSADAKERIAVRVKEIEESLSNYDGRNRFSRRARFDEERVRRLIGEVITVWVGGETDSEIIERKDRFEDVIKAVKSALVNGIVPGVGTTLIDAMNAVIGQIHAEENKDSYPEDWTEITGGLVDVASKQFETLMEGIILGDNPDRDVIDLATGRRGQPADLGIYDTAFAAITALKGGMQTAKILASMSSVLISNKLFAVSTGE